MCVCVWWRWTTCKHQQTPSVVRCVSSVFICVSSVLEIYTKSICSWNWMFLGCDFPMYWGQCTSNPFTVFCSQGCLGRISNSFWTPRCPARWFQDSKKIEWLNVKFRSLSCNSATSETWWQTEKREQVPSIKARNAQDMQEGTMAGALHFVNDMSNEESWTKTCVLKSKTTWSSYATVDGYLG